MNVTEMINACKTFEELDEVLNEVLTQLSNQAAHISLEGRQVSMDKWESSVIFHWDALLDKAKLKKQTRTTKHGMK